MADVQAAAMASSAPAADRAVIINADDFGFSAEVNAGVIHAHRHGVLTSASLMVAARGAAEAARAAREIPALDVGLHLVVCKGTSVLAPAEIAPLVDGRGRFVENPVMGGLRYFFDRRMRRKLAAEFRAQIDKHLELVGYLNHIDGHLNFHVHPVLADIMVELAAEYRVPCIRIPREPIATTLALARDHLGRKLVEGAIFRLLSRRTRIMAERRGIRSPGRLFGLHQSGHLTEAYVVGVIERLGGGVSEFYFHPAMAAGGAPPPATARREVEILTSGRVRAALAARGVRLTTFADLARKPTAACAFRP